MKSLCYSLHKSEITSNKEFITNIVRFITRIYGEFNALFKTEKGEWVSMLMDVESTPNDTTIHTRTFRLVNNADIYNVERHMAVVDSNPYPDGSLQTNGGKVRYEPITMLHVNRMLAAPILRDQTLKLLLLLYNKGKVSNVVTYANLLPLSINPIHTEIIVTQLKTLHRQFQTLLITTGEKSRPIIQSLTIKLSDDKHTNT
jgi:hypothetical protein